MIILSSFFVATAIPTALSSSPFRPKSESNTPFPVPCPHRLSTPFPGLFQRKDIVTFDGKRLTKSANA